jgi:hypothetical protein
MELPWFYRYNGARTIAVFWVGSSRPAGRMAELGRRLWHCCRVSVPALCSMVTPVRHRVWTVDYIVLAAGEGVQTHVRVGCPNLSPGTWAAHVLYGAGTSLAFNA